MIIQKVFHTYKEDFPLLSKGRIAFGFDANALDTLFASLIMDLSELTSLTQYTYITRHTNDKIPIEHLKPFLTKFRNFVSYLGLKESYGIPTVWFVGHFESQDQIKNIRERLDKIGVRYFETGSELNSFEEINDTYWKKKSDAEVFIEFLHQVTMIGIDLLSGTDFKQKLEQLKRLEWMQYASEEAMEPDLKEMERYLNEKSPYYIKEIAVDVNKRAGFWKNFTKIKVTPQSGGSVGLGSWPHFLFNICGVNSSVNNLPLQVET